MRVHIVDPSAYTPPYDDALCGALAAAGADVELHTSRFAYGPVPAPDGYRRHLDFYRAASHVPAPAARRAVKLASHVPDMLRYRRTASRADLVHFQWLTVQHLDGHLLPRGRPLVITAHDVLPREPRPGQRAAQRRLYDRFDAVVAHSEHGRARLTGELGLDPGRVHVIPHGALDALTGLAPAAPPDGERPLVLFAGLLRPYKGIDLLLRAWEGIEGADLLVAGMPRMDIADLEARVPAGARLQARYLPDAELASLMRRASLVVLPYREIEQSGVLFTALAFGRPLLLSDVGGFPEIAAQGAARTFPAGDAAALHDAIAHLLARPGELAAMAARAAELAHGEYGWESIARRTLELYGSLTGAGA